MQRFQDQDKLTLVATAAAGIGLGFVLLKALVGPKKRTGPQVILITGASSGIGKATALKLIADGHCVYGAARRIAHMQDLVDAGGHAIEMDVTKEDQIVSAVTKVLDEQKRIDVLINNAGFAVYGSIEDVTMEEARSQFEVNIFGLARLTKEVLPTMRAQMNGKIINVSSVGGKIYTPFGAWYHATKHALEGWSDCLRLDVNQFNIKVVIIEPGAIGTEFEGVMSQPFLDRSKGSPYESNAIAFMNAGRDMIKYASPPSVIANVVSLAVSVAKPRRRYVAGAFASPMLFIRAWFGDGVMDTLLLSQLK